ncbi:hypothetical protein JTB14_028882 [Gonioctena quinquepunctata]|nr:hypothetical protein JTB14_028882 [Gonioctena quinquepunctata]
MKELNYMEKVQVIQIQKVLLSGEKKKFKFRCYFRDKIGYKKSGCRKLKEKDWKDHRSAHIVEKDNDDVAYIGCVNKTRQKL